MKGEGGGGVRTPDPPPGSATARGSTEQRTLLSGSRYFRNFTEVKLGYTSRLSPYQDKADIGVEYSILQKVEIKFQDTC